MKKSFGLSALLLMLIAALSACGGGGGGGAPGPGVLTGTIAAQYSNAPNWNDYVRASDTATACDGAETGGYSACIHGGEKKAVPVTGKTSCTGLTATDSLGAFDWTCDGSTNPVQMVSTGLKDGKNLSDLIDFTTPAWKPNSVTVYAGGTAYLATGSSAWWMNPMQVDNDGMTAGEMDIAGTVYLVTVNATATYAMGAGKIALVIKPGVVLQGTAAASENIVSADSVNFLWIEGTINVAGDNAGVYLTGVVFSALRGVTASNGSVGGGIVLSASSNNRLTGITASNNAGSGVQLVSSSGNNMLTEITATNNGQPGIRLSSSSNNTLSAVTASSNTTYGVYVATSSNNNTLAGVTASNNGSVGVYLASSSSNNTLIGVTASNNISGVILETSYNTLIGVTASNNSSRGVELFFSSNNTLAGVTAANNGVYGFNLNASSNNYFTGLLKVGNNASGDCYVNLGTNPGLDDDADPSDVETDGTNNGLCVQEGAAYGGLSDFGAAVTGVTLASSFVGKTYTDGMNASDTGSAVVYPADPATFDWLNFDDLVKSILA